MKNLLARDQSVYSMKEIRFSTTDSEKDFVQSGMLMKWCGL
ncbi:hypothetical protein ACVNS2_18530 [Paenibacillus caseinilyticus]|uniref:Uncharacterized protein n=2 Tax=Paenibacillus mucilaginosus TaxID=61624 RepID=I0BJU9_9BACL|nr:hypothetical protein [Paenibacillus mucilaginosus]AEI41885.1 hypothetical protein KNP414_03327 [Paenibacillus mucilaginosus KNP414]AFH62646.1 hypothetical protein B2K_18290 [Paenibacillus mucilaginosus K02]